jgi:hypothetical protein
VIRLVRRCDQVHALFEEESVGAIEAMTLSDLGNTYLMK